MRCKKIKGKSVYLLKDRRRRRYYCSSPAGVEDSEAGAASSFLLSAFLFWIFLIS
ncbi:hypothetical protein LEP1GSC116_0085 [Leptospira interrogans serovar Icterohaemorrhagiae str. Verdun HP]|uniref:Uncharacterized protein n=1 Tax=Leptospira interrogans serovar Icterohaemorrhagiae str. Verdun HP TaxID=1049910 RepID=M6RD72_LEPIR|nr:hypothetical protein LEP1GSC116_0085 [Leptospira interrogans serovar Icterohaemorrhagiae str. Verdun HP]